MTETIIPILSEFEKLLEEVRKLRARVIELTTQRDDLLYHICPSLQAKYDEKIGSVERELLAAQMYLKEKQRIIEILQAQLNRQEKPSMKEAEKKAHAEFSAYEEELKRKAEEARKFREHWEQETQWSKHEQESGTRKKEKRSNGTSAKDPWSRADQSEGTEGTRNEADKAKASSAQGASHEEEIHKRIGAAYGEGVSSEESNGEKDVREEEDPIQELKRLYRQIVKRLHPDVHPNPTEREKDLLNRANKAYKAGDLAEMRRIWEELTGIEQSEESFDDTEEGRERLRELIKTLRKRCKALEEEIKYIKASFPYTAKTLLDDDNALEHKHQELVKQLEEVRALFDQVDAYIAELKRRMKEQ